MVSVALRRDGAGDGAGGAGGGGGGGGSALDQPQPLMLSAVHYVWCLSSGLGRECFSLSLGR
jgi:hypothetical protein